MIANEFKKLLKEKTPNQIIDKFVYNEITLTNSQLTKVLNMRKGTIFEGHGGFNTKRKMEGKQK